MALLICLLISQQAKPTQAEKILQLLQILPRSGQNFFECFLSVLRMRSVWLADKLQRKYNEKMARSQQGKIGFGLIPLVQSWINMSNIKAIKIKALQACMIPRHANLI